MRITDRCWRHANKGRAFTSYSRRVWTIEKNEMKLFEKPANVQVGVFFIGFAALAGIFVLPGAGETTAPILYICVFGGLFVGIPAVLGGAIIAEHLNIRPKTRR
jgi:hypothetical protein